MDATTINGIDIPKAKAINYSDSNEICGYQLLLCKRLECCGGLSEHPHRDPQLRQILLQGRIWIDRVQKCISTILTDSTYELSLADLPDILTSFDFMHRICYGTPCFDYIRSVRLAAVKRWLNGDKTLSSTDLTIMLLSEVDRECRTIEQRYIDYCGTMLEQWVNELTRFGLFRNIPLGEAYSRLTYLLKTDLFAFLGNDRQTSCKRQWVRFYATVDYSAIDAQTLRKYICFIRTAAQFGLYSSAETDDEQYERLWSEYIARHDIHPFYRQALSFTGGC